MKRAFWVMSALAALVSGCECGPVPSCVPGCSEGLTCLDGRCIAVTTGGGAADSGVDAGTGGGGGGGGVTTDGGEQCGDGVLGSTELCDDGNTANLDGCNQACALEPNYACPTPGQACVSTVVCGDGLRTGAEACDDRNTTSGDGCSSGCALEPGWICPVVGVACSAAECGDGVRAGFEECDDDNVSAGDGCSATCVNEEGFACTTPGQACMRTVCGNNTVEGIEQCDDGNHDLGDGCDTDCHREPRCTNGTCQAVCGDGIRQGGEPCDDGNTRGGDGCSATCTVESGFMCADMTAQPPASLDIPIVYRDFLPFGVTNGHIDFENGNGDEQGIVAAQLGADGKPVYAGGAGTVTTHGAGPFNQWYRDTANVNRTEVGHLVVSRDGTGSYVFDSDSFFPLDGKGWASDGTEPPRFGHNFNFTSELRYWFNFAGNESLTFRGDDDVWVFINGRLAVDLGGVHGPMSGGVVLDPTRAAQLNLVAGGIYEAVVLQAERHTTGSNYRLTLRGFNAPKSSCTWRCGDGVVTRYEACDDGVNDGRYGGCQPGCQARGGFCGDGQVQADGGEVCDDGANTGGANMCAPGCRARIGCGDGIIQPALGESCDDGNTTPGDGCNEMCVIELG